MFVNRWYQDEAILSIFNYFNEKSGNPIVAMPTGTGKSIVIADFIKKVVQQWPNQRFMMLTHVKELIAQNANKLQALWPNAPLGIHSAGLNKRDTVLPIIFGGVQSVRNTIKKAMVTAKGIPPQYRHFGHRDLLIIDECHLLSPNDQTMYQYIIRELKEINPFLKVIGFTATPYRMKHGMLIEEGGIFTDICYDITGMESFNRLIAEGFLSPLIPKRTGTELDVSSVGKRQGDFIQGQLQQAVDKEEITYKAVKEMCELAHDRKCWMLFASGIEHCEHITGMLQSFGISTTFVHSKINATERNARLDAFKNGQYRAIVGFRVLTTGFDHPPIDCIGDFYPTLSTGMHVQKNGRGTRPSPETGKQNCLVLDYAANTRRLGPINDPLIPRKGQKTGGDAPVRICEECGVYNHASAKYCIACGAEFSFEIKIFSTAGTDELLKSDEPTVEYKDVIACLYNLHEKKDKKGNRTSPPSIKVSYICGINEMYHEWICLEHKGFAYKKAVDWWRQRHENDPPPTTESALKIASNGRIPKRIRVLTSSKYPEILAAEF